MAPNPFVGAATAFLRDSVRPAFDFTYISGRQHESLSRLYVQLAEGPLMTLPGFVGTVLFFAFLSLYFAVSGGDMEAWRAWGPWSGLLDAGVFASMVGLIIWDGKRRDRR